MYSHIYGHTFMYVSTYVLMPICICLQTCVDKPQYTINAVTALHSAMFPLALGLQDTDVPADDFGCFGSDAGSRYQT